MMENSMVDYKGLRKGATEHLESIATGRECTAARAKNIKLRLHLSLESIKLRLKLTLLHIERLKFIQNLLCKGPRDKSLIKCTRLLRR